MALVKGTNCGFVTTAPTSDPQGGGGGTMDYYSYANKDTTAAGVTKITEIGWWCNNATEAANFEVGLYSHDSGANKPLNRIHVDATNAKGTTSGWKTVSVDWAVSANTTYWIAVQLDNTPTATTTDLQNLIGERYWWLMNQASLNDPWTGGGDGSNNYLVASYAKTESGGSGGGRTKVEALGSC